MEENKGFDPYIDWKSMDDKMAKDFIDAYKEFDDAKNSLSADPTKENVARLMRAQESLSEIDIAIRHSLWSVPVMVHIAGPVQEREDQDGHESVQLCKRCGSILQRLGSGIKIMTSEGLEELTPSDISWWPEGSQVAKGETGGRLAMYMIDQKLEKNEFPCPDLADMGLGEDENRA